jgi:HEAT repeat protein
VLSGVVGNDAKVRLAVLDRLVDDVSYIRASALQALSGVVGNDAEVRRAVMDRLKDKDSDVRVSALEALSSVVRNDVEVRRAVIDRIGDNVPEVRGSALEALSSVVGNDAEVRRAVMDRMGDKVPDVRVSALEALSSILRKDTEVRRAVMDRMGDEAPNIRRKAIEVLSDVVENDAEARQAVLDRIGDREEKVRAAAVSAISGLLKSDENLHGLFMSLLSDRSFDVRVRAVLPLLPLIMSSGNFSPHLAAWISSDSDREWGDSQKIQNVLASVLGPRLPGETKIREWILERLRDIRWSSRLGATLCLLAWPGGPPREIMDQIFKALEDQRGLESYPARLTAASFLINRNEDKGASIDLCLEALDYGTQPWEGLSNASAIRKQAALILGKLEPLEHNQRVYDRLFRVLKEDEEPEVRDAAYNALVRLAGVRDRQTAA